MAFHQPFLNQLAVELPDADVLMGKPLPVDAARKFYQTLGISGFRPERQLQWLIDTDQRLKEYQALARALGIKLRVSVELDIGLHRGGFNDIESLRPVLDRIVADRTHLELAGFMGYEAFIVKQPSISRSLAGAKADYRALVDAGRAHRPELFTQPLTYNIAGSQTYRLYENDTFFNDICEWHPTRAPCDPSGRSPRALGAQNSPAAPSSRAVEWFKSLQCGTRRCTIRR